MDPKQINRQQITYIEKQIKYLQNDLQEKKVNLNNLKKNENQKRKEVEPNLHVLSNWLNTTGKLIDDDAIFNNIVKDYNDLTNREGAWKILPDSPEEREIFKNNAYKIRDTYKAATYRRTQRLKNKEYKNSPIILQGEALKEFIEALHNIFVIQEKRISDLEQKINKSIV